MQANSFVSLLKSNERKMEQLKVQQRQLHEAYLEDQNRLVSSMQKLYHKIIFSESQIKENAFSDERIVKKFENLQISNARND